MGSDRQGIGGSRDKRTHYGETETSKIGERAEQAPHKQLVFQVKEELKKLEFQPRYLGGEKLWFRLGLVLQMSVDLKLVLLGHKNVGKTSVFNRYGMMHQNCCHTHSFHLQMYVQFTTSTVRQA